MALIRGYRVGWQPQLHSGYIRRVDQTHGRARNFAPPVSKNGQAKTRLITSSSRSSSTCPGPTMLRSSTTFVGGPEITAPCDMIDTQVSAVPQVMRRSPCAHGTHAMAALYYRYRRCYTCHSGSEVDTKSKRSQ